MKRPARDRLRCPECQRPLKPFMVNDGDLGRSIHEDFDDYFSRHAWACLPCGSNLYVLRDDVVGAIDAIDAAELVNMDAWGMYGRRRDHRAARERAAVSSGEGAGEAG